MMSLSQPDDVQLELLGSFSHGKLSPEILGVVATGPPSHLPSGYD
jgi:hypothetical protein